MSVVDTQIHPSAIVSPKARLGAGVKIGPFSVINDDVEIGDRTELISHVVLADGARIGADVRIYPGAVIGAEPQDLKFKGEPTLAIIGDRTVIRECVTVNRGTAISGRSTVGSDVLLMAYSHVAHECTVGNHAILVNSVQLGGHVEVGEWAIVGGLTGVHQFCRIGAHCMIGACVKVAKDVPPYTLAGRQPLVVEGLNTVGLRRRGFTAETIADIEEFYRLLLHAGYNTSDGIKAYVDAHPVINPDVQKCIDFIHTSKRGITRN